MKKLFLTALVAMFAFTANAQVWMGGEVGFWQDDDADRTTIKVNPEVGYNLSDTWSLGVALQIGHTKTGPGKRTTLGVSPYARFNYAKFGPVSLFLDGGFTYATSKPKGGDAANAFEIGIKPGAAVSLNEKLGFVTHFGFLGYGDDEIGGYNNGFGFNLSSYNLTFGLYYNF